MNWRTNFVSGLDIFVGSFHPTPPLIYPPTPSPPHPFPPSSHLYHHRRHHRRISLGLCLCFICRRRFVVLPISISPSHTTILHFSVIRCFALRDTLSCAHIDPSPTHLVSHLNRYRHRSSLHLHAVRPILWYARERAPHWWLVVEWTMNSSIDRSIEPCHSTGNSSHHNLLCQ